ncbi:aldo/keto reductase, partial [Leuconostoc mesenteroides]|nr:aldo/keto reductase [Leuconostoc mesenteroides]
GILPVAKATTPQHQRRNLDIFDFTLTETEVSQISDLERKDGRVDDQDPKEYEEFV